MERQDISAIEAREMLATGEGVIVNAAALEQLFAGRDQLRAEVDRLRTALDASQYNLKNLLATIHRDGGQYLAEHGEPKAFCDALDTVVNTTARAEAAEKERDEWRTKALDVEKHPVVVALMRELNEAQSLVAVIRGALEEAGDVVHACFCETEEIRGKVCHPSCTAINAALALTPASAGNRIKVEATRKCAAVLRDDLIAAAGDVQGTEFINAIYAASGWLEQMADGIEAEAEKEAANGR